MTENEISKIIIGSAIKVHKILGPGLLESAYEACLLYELNLAGLHVLKQYPLPLIYKEINLQMGYRLDLLVENKVVVEIKAVENITDIHLAQVITYLKVSHCKLGLILNFNELILAKGIKRVVNML